MSTPVLHLIEFLRESDHAALMHLSTCYVVGGKDGRVVEEVQPNYTPLGVAGFRRRARMAIAAGSGARMPKRAPKARKSRRRCGGRRWANIAAAKSPPGPELENLIRKNRMRWLRNRLTRAGTRRARRLGWPNTYTLYQIAGRIPARDARRGAADRHRAALDRRNFHATSRFRGWNEGINTSAPLSYLLGTYFRQLPTNERKCLDVIPVDMVCRGMTLIAAAIIERRHEPIYQLATSASNPCDMGRSIELTGLAHRKHYRAQQSLETLDAHAVRHHSRFQIALREIFRAGAKGRGPGHQSRRFGAAVEAAAAGPRRNATWLASKN